MLLRCHLLRCYAFLILAYACCNLGAVSIDCERSAQIHEVMMMNRSSKYPADFMIFDPPVLHVCPGDTVRWVEKDSGHNTKSVIVPEGASGWAGYIGENKEVVFQQPGTYIYECSPHVFVGMMGVVIVGAMTERPVLQPKLDQFYSMYPTTKARLDRYLNEAEKSDSK